MILDTMITFVGAILSFTCANISSPTDTWSAYLKRNKCTVTCFIHFGLISKWRNLDIWVWKGLANQIIPIFLYISFIYFAIVLKRYYFSHFEEKSNQQYNRLFFKVSNQRPNRNILQWNKSAGTIFSCINKMVARQSETLVVKCCDCLVFGNHVWLFVEKYPHFTVHNATRWWNYAKTLK